MIAPRPAIVRPAVLRSIIVKDFRLYWPALLIVPIIAGVLWLLEVFGINNLDSSGGTYGLAQLAAAFVIIAVVQQDPPTSEQHDWLTRPIGKLEMLLAKALFLIGFALVPLGIGHAAIQLTGGLPPGAIFAGACLSTAIYLPLAMTYAALTRTLGPAIGFLFVALLAFIVFSLTSLHNVVLGAPVHWIISTPVYAAIVPLSLVALWLAYDRRALTTSRLIYGFGLAGLMALTSYTPVGVLFGLQEAIAGNPAAAAAVSLNAKPGCIGDAHAIEFSPAKGGVISLSPSGAAATANAAVIVNDDAKRPSEQDLRKIPGDFAPTAWVIHQYDRAGPGAVAFTTHVDPAGVPNGDLLLVDYVHGAYLDASGQRTGAPIIARRVSESYHHTGPADFDETWLVSRADAGRQANARLKLDYDLSLVAPAGSWTVPADGKWHAIGDIGRCQVGKAPSGVTPRLLTCKLTGPAPALMTAQIGSAPVLRGEPNYTPGWQQAGGSDYAIDMNAEKNVPDPTATIAAYTIAAHVHRTALAAPGAIGGAVAACP